MDFKLTDLADKAIACLEDDDMSGFYENSKKISLQNGEPIERTIDVIKAVSAINHAKNVAFPYLIRLGRYRYRIGIKVKIDNYSMFVAVSTFELTDQSWVEIFDTDTGGQVHSREGSDAGALLNAVLNALSDFRLSDSLGFLEKRRKELWDKNKAKGCTKRLPAIYLNGTDEYNWSDKVEELNAKLNDEALDKKLGVKHEKNGN